MVRSFTERLSRDLWIEWILCVISRSGERKPCGGLSCGVERISGSVSTKQRQSAFSVWESMRFTWQPSRRRASELLQSAAAAAAFVVSAPSHVQAATVYPDASNRCGGDKQLHNVAGHWSDGNAPAAASDYSVRRRAFQLRTPASGTINTFAITFQWAEFSLTLGSGTALGQLTGQKTAVLITSRQSITSR